MKGNEKMEKTSNELKKELFYIPDNAALSCSDEEIATADAFCEGYKAFLDNAKTEREAVLTTIELCKKNGFSEYDPTVKYAAGDKVYYNNRSKALILAVFGSESLENGVKIAAAHIDSPRLDLKPSPLYESDDLALFKTHYYGGIKKYQWVAIPLALHGVVAKKDGTTVNITIGEKEGEPKFVISDILPHLGAEQAKRSLNEGIKGEELNVLVGSRHYKGKDLDSDSRSVIKLAGTTFGLGESSLVKLNVLKILNDKYGITERDFLSAELEVVPAFKADDIGFDRSMVGGYGHDDKVCAYPAVMAAINIKDPVHTVLTVLADKEEIGSEGNTGLVSDFMKNFIYRIAASVDLEGYDVLSKSECVSADDNAAYDQTFSDVFEAKNASFINRGVVVTKYTGARGKSGTNDASAEFMGKMRRILDDKGIVWQIGELGKVDAGGGGTVAKYISQLDVDVVDIGVPVLSMHAPYEVISKLDIYMAYRAFFEFFAAE